MKGRTGKTLGLSAAALGLLAYIGLPYLAVQVGNLGLIREGRRGKREVALTFDDGPDPQTTPAVLDALKEVGAKATFFVLPDRAEAHPGLIARMVQEGHQVEAHGDQHRHAWMRSPWGAFADPQRAVQRVQRVKGQRVKGQQVKGQQVTLQRPPHGAYTLATLLGQRRAGVTGAHWSIESHDWDRKFTPAQVQERLNRLVVPGAVIVLHDAGPGAKNTVPMLPGLLADLKGRGYSFVTMQELGAAPQKATDLRRRLFGRLDRLFDRLYGLRYSGDQADNLWRIGRVNYPFGDLTLADGTRVHRGLPAAEFHINSPLMVDLGLRRVVRQGPVDFRLTAHDLLTRPELAQAEVVYCVSSFASLVQPFGFETHEIPGADAQRLRRWSNVLRRVYGSATSQQRPQLSIMSRARVRELYGPQP